MLLPILSAIVLCVVAFYAGKGIAEQRANAGYEEYIESKKMFEREIIDNYMKVDVGDTVPDLLFESLSGEHYRLSELVKDSLMVCYVSTTCPSCESQVRNIVQTVSTPDECKRFVFITHEPLEHMIALRGNKRHTPLFLQDFDRRFKFATGIVNLPTNLVLDSELRIRDLHLRPLTPPEIIAWNGQT